MREGGKDEGRQETGDGGNLGDGWMDGWTGREKGRAMSGRGRGRRRRIGDGRGRKRRGLEVEGRWQESCKRVPPPAPHDDAR